MLIDTYQIIHFSLKEKGIYQYKMNKLK